MASTKEDISKSVIEKADELELVLDDYIIKYCSNDDSCVEKDYY